MAEMQAALDKAHDETVVAQASIDKVKSDKDVAVKELVDVKLELAKEKSAHENAEETTNKWRNDYNLAGKKMNVLFDAIAPYMETCRPFRDEVSPFMVEYEPEDITSFDVETLAMDEGKVADSPLVDKALVSQSDDIVNITDAMRRDANYTNPDDPANNEN